MKDEELYEQKAAIPGDEKGRYIHRDPWWFGFALGRIYRPVMRLMHQFGWCYPSETPIHPGAVWCHWCGMRGQRPLKSRVPFAA